MSNVLFKAAAVVAAPFLMAAGLVMYAGWCWEDWRKHGRVVARTGGRSSNAGQQS